MKTELEKQIEFFYKSDKKLEDRMKELAKVFLYGGYLNVRNQYHIYIRTLEFYYHEEEGLVKDLIMYHRNNNKVAGKIPYFNTLSLNSHDTGVDITFENEQKKIRASILIRAYEVLDVKSNNRLVWDKDEQQFRACTEMDKPRYNTQSMYVKKFLSGFATKGTIDIYWVDLPYKEEFKDSDILPMKRQGVYISEDKEKYIPNKKIKDEKFWGVRREKEISLE